MRGALYQSTFWALSLRRQISLPFSVHTLRTPLGYPLTIDLGTRFVRSAAYWTLGNSTSGTSLSSPKKAISGHPLPVRLDRMVFCCKVTPLTAPVAEPDACTSKVNWTFGCN